MKWAERDVVHTSANRFSLDARARRCELGIPQSLLAHRLDHSPAWLNRIESGEREPNLRDLESLCLILGLRIGA